jgi:cytidine deaminase
MEKIYPTPFKPSESDGVLTVHLNPENDSALDPAVLNIPEIEHLPFSGKKVLFEGKAPLWMYTHFAVRAAACGAEEVSIKQAGAGETRVWFHGPILAAGRDGPGTANCFKLTQESSGVARLEFNKAPDEKGGKWEVGDLEKTPLCFPDETKVFIIAGGAANWMCAAAALAANDADIQYILYDSPREKSIISVGVLEPGRLLPHRKRVENGIVIGIAGDPNSGKSVFRGWLEKIFRDEWPNSWWIEADPASPTPNWYLDGLNSRQAEEVKKTRNESKKEWTHELEIMAAGILHNARENLDLTLVDLPGGDHRAFPPRRIPPGREVIFNEIDLFIIIWKSEAELEAWRSVLREHDLENQIFAEIKSQEPEAAPSLETHREGNRVIGTARGLNRTHDGYSAKPAISSGAAALIRHIRSWIIAQYAKSAISKAFLTGQGGVRYGAAVLCADGKIYTAGQYSSFNHSTNIHAEQGALLQAVMGGSFVVRVLALASTDNSAVPRPCGVCRQVMLEHIRRTGSSFDVAMVDSAGRIEIESVDALLPFSWESHKSRGNHGQSLRRIEPRLPAPSEDTHFQAGACVQWADKTAVGIVWKNAFLPGQMLVKLKYVKTPSGEWLKLPHSLTESFDYMNALQKAGFTRPTGFGPSACLVTHKDIEGFASFGIEEDLKFPEAFARFLEEAEIDISRFRYTGSRALGLENEDSDFDIFIKADTADVRRFRETARIWIENGKALVPRKSETWRLFDKVFPGGSKQVIEEKRFFESLEFGGRKVSIIFTGEEKSFTYNEEEWEPAGRCTVSGMVNDDADAPFKKAAFPLTTDFRKHIEVVSYYKLANLVKPGDRLSLSGWLLNSKNGNTQRLVQLLPGYDPIVWLP